MWGKSGDGRARKRGCSFLGNAGILDLALGADSGEEQKGEYYSYLLPGFLGVCLGICFCL